MSDAALEPELGSTDASTALDVLSSGVEAEPCYETPEQLIEILCETNEVDLTAEDMDPLEWTFRKVVPIPKYYYWDIVKNPDDKSLVPNRIKLWHTSIASMTSAFQWTEQRIGMPLARTLGLTSPRFNDVTMFMTRDDWRESKRIVTNRNRRREQESLVVHDSNNEAPGLNHQEP